MRVKITSDTQSTKGNLAWYHPCVGQTFEVYDKDEHNYGTTWAIEPYKCHQDIPKADAQIVE